MSTHTTPGLFQKEQTLIDALHDCGPLWRAWVLGQEEKKAAVRGQGWEPVKMTVV